MSRSLLALAVVASSSGCAAFLYPFNAQQNTAAAIAEGRAQADALAAKATRDMVVTGEVAWLCMSREEALAGKPCPGGRSYTRGQSLAVFGAAAEGGLRNATFYDEGGRRDGFVRAELVAERDAPSAVAPEVKQLNARIKERFQGKDYLEYHDRYTKVLLDRGAALRGQCLMITVTVTDFLREVGVASDTVTYLTMLQTESDSKTQAPVAFSFKRNEWFTKRHARAAEGGAGYAYSCGPRSCDQVTLVGRYQGRPVSVTLANGLMVSAPLFEVVAAVDRNGGWIQP